MHEEIRVLDHGFVRLDDAMADDLSVVNSARVSFGRRKTEMDDTDVKLINYLMVNRHGTPFEHNSFRFHIKAPIFVAREWFRHRIGSFNEFSTRYAEVREPDLYIPSEFRTQVGKPGAYSFEPWKGNRDKIVALILRDAQDSIDMYNHMIQQGIAREQAAEQLPLRMYTEFYWTVNARSLMNFINLRNSEHARMEIREYAMVVESIWAERMPVTAEAFRNNQRVAP